MNLLGALRAGSGQGADVRAGIGVGGSGPAQLTFTRVGSSSTAISAFQPALLSGAPRLTSGLPMQMRTAGHLSLIGKVDSAMSMSYFGEPSSSVKTPDSSGQRSDQQGSRRAPNLLTFETERSVELAEAAEKNKAPLPDGPRPNYLKFETVESLRRAKESETSVSTSPKRSGERDLLRFENEKP